MKDLSYTQNIEYFDITCDLCGRKAVEATSDFPRHQNVIWDKDHYEETYSTETKCILKNYGGADYVDLDVEIEYNYEYECHICPKCFIQKLIPFLESQKKNIKPTV